MSQIKPLETKILVGVTDHLDPQVRAMLMAMYSRTTGSILDRLPELEDQESLSQKFGTFYVGYGHKSVKSVLRKKITKCLNPLMKLSY